MKLFIQIFIAIVPLIFSFSTSDPTLSIRFLFFSIFISIIIAFDVYKKESFSVNIIKHPLSICLIVLIFSCFLSSIINGITSEAIYFLLRLILILLFVFVLSNFLLNNTFRDLIISLLIFSFLSSIIYFYQFFDRYDDILLINDIWHRNRAFDSISGYMGHKNLLASIHFLLLPVLIFSLNNNKLWIKIFASISLIFTVSIFFQTQSRAVIGALFIFLISYVLLSKIGKKFISKALLYSSVVFLIGFSFLYSIDRLDSFKKEITKTVDFSSSQRFALYNCTSGLILDNFFFGVGPGNWRIKIWEYGLYNNTFGASFAQRPHNDFLWLFAEGGFFAGISYILIFLILLKDSYWLYKNSDNPIFFKLVFCMLLGYGFVSMFDFPFERISHLIIFFLFASIVISYRLKTENNIYHRIPVMINILLVSFCFASVYIGFIRFNSDVYTTKAISFKQKNNWGQVVKNIDKGYSKMFYSIDGTSTPLLWYKGIANFYQKKLDLASSDFQGAYSENPNHIHVLNNLATLYEMNGKYALAKQYYEKSLVVNPTFKEARVNLSAIIYNEGNYLEALDIILGSKVDLYWRRQRDNDNYDFYLKTIFRSWVKNISDEIVENDLKRLNDLSLYFDKHPASAARKLKVVFEKKNELSIDYIEALKIIEKEM